MTGHVGENGRICQSKALDVRIDTYLTEYVGGYKFWSDFWIENRVAESRCSTRYVNTTARIKVPQPREPLKFIPVVIAYKDFLRENMKNVPFGRSTQKTYDAIESNDDINDAYTVADFVVEANALEKQHFELDEHIDFLPFYDNLLKRIESFVSAKNKTSDREVLALLYTAILSKTSSMRSSHQSDLIIDIERYLESIIRNIKELDETSRIRAIGEHRDKYNLDLIAKIDEANEFIANDVQPEIDALFAVLDTEMREVVEETIVLQTKTIADIESKKENEKTIRSNAMIRIVTGGLKVLAEAISFFGKGGDFVAAVISASATAVDALVVDPETKILEVPLAVGKISNDLKEQLALNVRNTVDALENQLIKLNDSFARAGLREYGGKIDALMVSIASIKTMNPIPRNDADTIFNDFSAFVNAEKKKLVAVNRTTQVAEQLERTANVLVVVETSISLYQQYSGDIDSERLDTIGKAINDDREQLIALKLLESQIQAELMPLINALQTSLGAAGISAAEKSSVALDVQQWRVHKTIRSVQRKLIESIGGFKNDYGVGNCLVRIDEAFNMLTNIYDGIQTYQEQSKLVAYMGYLQLANIHNMEFDDDQMRANVRELQFNLQANIVLSQFNRAIDAFKQAVFPFAAGYLSIYQLPATLGGGKNLTAVVTAAADKVKSLHERIEELNSTVINRNDELIHIARFDRDNNGSRPFYIWPNGEVKDKISRLFDGEKIYLLADVKRGGSLNAVKFSAVDLQFFASNRSANDQLHGILQNFRVALTHMGGSNYRCNQHFYTISSRPQTMEYSYGEKYQEPIDRNLVYDKLRSGNRLLSPYALWAVQLKNGPFQNLRSFVDSVDIELHGRGQYVVENATICNTNLQKYYSPMNSL